MSNLYNFGIGFVNFTPVGANAPGSPSPTQYLVVQDVSIDYGFTNKPFLGQLTFPVAVARGEGKIDVKIKYGRISLKTVNDAIFAGTVATGQNVIQINEKHTAAASITIAPPSSGTFVSDQGVLDGNGNTMILALSAPAVGSYEVNNSTGVYTFNASQTGTLQISYAYSLTTGFNVAVPNKPMGQSPQAQMWVANSNWGNNLAIFIPQLVFTKLSLPQKNTDWTLVDSEAQAYSDSAGNVSYWYGDY